MNCWELAQDRNVWQELVAEWSDLQPPDLRERVYLKALRCSSVICRYELTDLSSLSSSKTAKLLPANRCIVTAVK